MDTYQNFHELMQAESDYAVEIRDQASPVTILAPHGGRIEPHTSEIARLIAGSEYNCYCFNGLKPRDNQRLHITSHRYDEKQALTLVRNSAVVISVHGCRSPSAMVAIGGRDQPLIEAISEQLRRCRIEVTQAPQGSSGTHPGNICNRGRGGAGVQLEISRPLRDSEQAWQQLAAAIRSALALHLAGPTGRLLEPAGQLR